MEEFRRHRRPVSGNDLSQALGVSIRTLYRDIASLRSLGAEVEGEPGLGYVLRSGFVLPPVMFTVEEVDALILGSRWVSERADKPLAEAARKAIARLRAVMPNDLSDRIDAKYVLVGPSENAPQDTINVSAVRQAIHHEHKLSIHYSNAEGKTSERIIWPFLLSYFDGGRLISAWCELRNDIRHFRTGRIASLAELSTRYPRRRHELVKLWHEAEVSPRHFTFNPKKHKATRHKETRPWNTLKFSQLSKPTTPPFQLATSTPHSPPLNRMPP